MLGGFPGALAGLGAVSQGADYSAALAQNQRLRQMQILEAQNYLRNQQMRQQALAGIGGLFSGGLPTGGQQAGAQDATSALSGYGPNDVQRQALPPPLPSVPSYAGAFQPNLAPGVNWAGESPQFKSAFGGMMSGLPANVQRATRVDSAYRSPEQQAEIYARSGQGRNFMAAPPGLSEHQRGNAADLSFANPQAERAVRGAAPGAGLSFPFTQPNARGLTDPNHIQLAINSLPQPQQSQAKAGAQAVVHSVPKPLQGMLDISMLAKLIEQRAPGLPDEVKGMIFLDLMPLMHQQAKEDFQQRWQMFKFGEQQADRDRLRGIEERRLGIESGRAEQTAQREQTMEAETRRYHDIEAGQRATTEAETKRYHDLVAAGRETKSAQSIQKKQMEAEKQIGDQEELARNADELAKMVTKNPALVGTKGALGRLKGTIQENAPEWTGIHEAENPDVAAFANRINMLQAKLQKTLLGSRYYSGLAQRKLDAIVPALGALTAPSTTLSALNDIANTLRSEAKQQRTILGRMKLTPEEAAPDYGSMTTEELIELRQQQKGGQ